VWHPSPFATATRPSRSFAPSLAGNAYPAFTDYDHLPQECRTLTFCRFILCALSSSSSPKSEVVAFHAAGVAQLMYPELPRLRNRRHQSQWHFFCSHAEHTMGLLIALARNFPDSFAIKTIRVGASRICGTCRNA